MVLPVSWFRTTGLALTLALTASQPAFALDDQRSGFYLGLGAGVHNTDVQDPLTIFDEASDPSKESGIATSLKIGGGFNEHFVLYYVNNVSWFSKGSETILTGITGVGTTWYLQPTSPSLLVTLAAGLGSVGSPFEPDAVKGTGPAYQFGIGYEFRKHLQVEAQAFAFDLNISEQAEDTGGNSVQIVVSYVFY